MQTDRRNRIAGGYQPATSDLKGNDSPGAQEKEPTRIDDDAGQFFRLSLAFCIGVFVATAFIVKGVL